ncbi:uncharacterized protein LOC126824715 [Patella vulgata]|uniref:uncharacterized protein LOC126824715 n=1 Tax=Patella vulgata TaxID=6465 RepID=UPI0021806200|nr:uncharacterized protein LOC126824715 [Patella vulgata]
MEVLSATDMQSKGSNNKYIDNIAEQFYEAKRIDFEVNAPKPSVMIFRFDQNEKKTENILAMEKNGMENADIDNLNKEENLSTSCKPGKEQDDITILLPKKKRDITIKAQPRKNKSKKKKVVAAKKWTNVPCNSIGLNLTLFPRPTKTCEFQGDIDNILNDIENELNEFEKRSAEFQTIVNYEDDTVTKCKYLRPSKHRKIEKACKQVKTKYCKSVRNNNGKTLFINHRVNKRMSLEARRTYTLYSQKTYAEKKLTEEEITVTRKQHKTQSSTWQNTNRSAPVQNLAHALDTTNNPTSFEANVLSLLINLQHRELTPEDYEILSMLDESVAPKTVSSNHLTSFKTEKVSDSLTDKMCSVCMEMYTLGQTVKYLPCGHEFHDHCIDMWLSNSSRNCPLDGLPVDSS